MSSVIGGSSNQVGCRNPNLTDEPSVTTKQSRPPATALCEGARRGALLISYTTPRTRPPRGWNWQGLAVCPEGFRLLRCDEICFSREYQPRRYRGYRNGGLLAAVRLVEIGLVQRFARLDTTFIPTSGFGCRSKLRSSQSISGDPKNGKPNPLARSNFQLS